MADIIPFPGRHMPRLAEPLSAADQATWLRRSLTDGAAAVTEADAEGDETYDAPLADLIVEALEVMTPAGRADLLRWLSSQGQR